MKKILIVFFFGIYVSCGSPETSTTTNSGNGNSTTNNPGATTPVDVNVTVVNNRATAIMNMRVGTTVYGNVASGATTAARVVQSGSQNVTSDSGETGTITIPGNAAAVLTVSNTGSLSVQ